MIRLEKLRKEFDELVAVNDLDVMIPQGEIYGLIGPNGAGKTTTIRMACGLLEPTGGKVHVAKVDVHQEPERAQQYIGYLSDFFSVYEDLKVWEYLDYFAHAYKMPESVIPARIDEVIHEVGLEVKTDAMVKGLSRGMKQRLGIARAVIHKPEGAAARRAGFRSRPESPARLAEFASLDVRGGKHHPDFLAHPHRA